LTLNPEPSFCTTTATDRKKALPLIHGWQSRFKVDLMLI
jgi:hypothetical protein